MYSPKFFQHTVHNKVLCCKAEANGSALVQASQLHMDDLGFIAEVQSALNTGELQQPVNGHVVQMVHVKMAEMHLRA